MATIWIKLNAATFNQATGTVLAADDADSRVHALCNANLAQIVPNPGGSPPAVPAPNPGGDFATDAELAAALAGGGTGGIGLPVGGGVGQALVQAPGGGLAWATLPASAVDNGNGTATF